MPLSPKKQTLSYMEKVDLSQLQESGLMDEIDQVQIQHTITAVFINTEEAKQQGILENETPQDQEDLLGSNDEEEVGKVAELADMKSVGEFEVYQKINSRDFKKFYFESVVPITRPLSLKNVFCCSMFKNKEILLPVKISLDRLTYRQIDQSINLVIQFQNPIMTHFKYIDIILVARHVIKNLDSNEGESVRKILTKDENSSQNFTVPKLANQSSIHHKAFDQEASHEPSSRLNFQKFKDKESFKS